MSHCHVSFRWGYVLNSETSPSANIVVTLIRQQRSSSLLFPLAVPLFEQRPETIPQVKGAVFASSLAFVKRSPENRDLSRFGGVWFSLQPKDRDDFHKKSGKTTVFQIHSRSLPWETSSRAPEIFQLPAPPECPGKKASPNWSPTLSSGPKSSLL